MSTTQIATGGGGLTQRLSTPGSVLQLSEGGKTACEVGRKPIALDVGIRTRILLWAALKQHLNGVKAGSIGPGDILVGCIADKDRFLGSSSKSRQQRVEGGGVGFAGGELAGHQRRIEQRLPAEILDLRPLGTNWAVCQEANAVVGTQLFEELFGIRDRHKGGGDSLAVGGGQLGRVGVGGIAGEQLGKDRGTALGCEMIAVGLDILAAGDRWRVSLFNSLRQEGFPVTVGNGKRVIEVEGDPAYRHR